MRIRLFENKNFDSKIVYLNYIFKYTNYIKKNIINVNINIGTNVNNKEVL